MFPIKISNTPPFYDHVQNLNVCNILLCDRVPVFLHLSLSRSLTMYPFTNTYSPARYHCTPYPQVLSCSVPLYPLTHKYFPARYPCTPLYANTLPLGTLVPLYSLHTNTLPLGTLVYLIPKRTPS